MAWEHERFSIRRISALTLSGLKSHENGERSDILDNYADPETLYQHVKKIGKSNFYFRISPLGGVWL